MDAQGRVLIPASLRRQLQLQPGEKLIPRIEDGKLILEKRSEVRRRLLGIFSPQEPSPVGELLEERRQEAERE
ncbi:hypothetical protein Dcar01_00758 [Deinococcus carri]|uniref:SpoVT-AbrB domain-containing protein n=2 Tax=Deinococcus carri TaxID=1211323 RepID=A0ABP9W3W2_9DEIO